MIKGLTKQPGLRLPDLLTVITIALVAYAASNVVHEGVGHGGACVALGGRPRVLSSVHFECGDEAMGSAARRGVARDSMSPFPWRPAMAVFGGALYFLLARRAAQWLRSLVGTDELSMTRGRMLTVPASGLLWLTAFLRGGEGSAAPAELDRSYVWIVAGCVVSLVFVGIVGPGVRF